MNRRTLVLADLAAVVAGIVAAFAAGALFGVDPPRGTSAVVLLALALAIGAPVVLAAQASVGLYGSGSAHRGPWPAVAAVAWAGTVVGVALAFAMPYAAPLDSLLLTVVAVGVAVGCAREAILRLVGGPVAPPVGDAAPTALAEPDLEPVAPAPPREPLPLVDGELPADVAVRVDGLHKVFLLPHEQVHTLKERLVHPARQRSFDELHALQDVAFDVRKGEFFGIVGRNGSGKSTLMKCLAGIYRSDAGDMWLRGRMAPFIELGVGFNPELTARDNVLINAVMLGLTPTQARERYDDIIAFAELEEFVDLKLKNYSSGMHVRLAFAVMVHVDADVLLIDEVLAVGDAAFQQKCYDALNRLHHEGRTILLVTHDMGQVQRFCGRALLLDRGRQVAVGDASSIARRYLRLNFAEEAAASELAELPEAGAGDGDGSAYIVDTWLQADDGRRTDVLEYGQGCAVCMRVRVRRDLSDPVFSFAVADDQHRRVFAVSTDWDRYSTGSFSAGEEIHVAVSFDNWFAPGRYFVSAQVAHGGTGLQLMDHREEAASVVVTGERVSAGIVDIPHAFHVGRAQRWADPTVSRSSA